MPRYLTLINFTDRGVREVKDSVHRSEGFRSAVQEAGGKVSDLYWALGEFDGAAILEAPDDQTAASLLLSLGQQGFVRTRTLRIYNADEFKQLLPKS